MFDIFEQPWTLLTTAVIVLLAVLTLRSIFPEKRRWWQLALPAFLAVAAFGLDFFVRTDLEKINATIKAGMKAVEEEDTDAIDSIIAANYSDSYHNTKQDLMRHCRLLLSEPLVEKNKKTALVIETSPPKATAALTVLTKFEEQSYVYKNYKPRLLTKIELHLQKQPDNRWLIDRAEVLELDRQPVNWRDIR